MIIFILLFSVAYYTVGKRFRLFTMMLQDLHKFKCGFQSFFKLYEFCLHVCYLDPHNDGEREAELPVSEFSH